LDTKSLKHIALAFAAITCLSGQVMARPLAHHGTHAAPLVDCPLRDAPFSVQSPLIDILLNADAKAALEGAGASKLAKFPPQFIGSQAPTFAAILSVKEAGNFTGLKAEALPALDAQLRRIPVTRADRIARCVRYDVVPPKLVIPEGRPRLLLFEKINGFRDGPSVDAAHAAFTAMAARKGWSIVTTQNGAAFSPAILKQFDAVIWNNISGDVLTLGQRRAFRSYMENGGGFVGVHGSAGDPVYFWDWYVDDLLGARFAGHPLNPQFQIARVQIEDAAHPAAKGLPATWDMNEEWYSFLNNPRASGSRIIATLDEKTYNPAGWPGKELHMGDHPIVWSRCIGHGRKPGRMFYSAIGHRPEHYGDAVNVQMLEQAVGWAAGTGGAGCRVAK